METLKLPFCHPVQGKINFLHPKDGHMVKSMQVNSNDNYEVEIPLNGITPGTWNIIFEWDQNGKRFSLSRSVVIE